MNKKLLSFLALCMSVSLTVGASGCAGCGGSSSNTSGSSNGAVSSDNSSSLDDSSLADTGTSSDDSSILIEESSSEQDSYIVDCSMPEDSSIPEDSSSAEDSSSPDNSVPEDSSIPEDNSSAEDSSSAGQAQPTKKTDEEIFQIIKAGVEATKQYNGAYTMTAHQYEEWVPEDEYEGDGTYSATVSITADPVTNRFIWITNGDKLYDVTKAYKQGNKYYAYTWNEHENGGYKYNSEHYERISSSYMNKYLKEESPAAYMNEWSSFTLAESYAELVAAYETVEASSLAVFADEMMGTGNVTVAVSQNGERYTLAIEMDAEMRDGETSYSGYYDVRYVVEDGKVAEVSAAMGIETVDGEETEPYAVQVGFYWDYAFDEEIFNSVEVPSTVEESSYIHIDFMYHGQHGHEEGVEVDYSKTAAELFAEMEKDWGRFNNAQPVEYTVEGWYLDENYTQRFDPSSMTIDELFEVEKLYGKDFSFTDGYALVIENTKEIESYSREYQIVKDNNFMSGYSGSSGIYPYFMRSGEVYTFGSYKDEVYVNGEKITADSFTYESGKVYDIVYVYYLTDAEYNIFEFLMY